MSFPDPSSPVVIAAANGATSLAAEFFKSGDRYGHRVVQVKGGRRSVLLESIEGDEFNAWPPSPPLQHLTVETRADGAVALLVGMAGRGHWSLSVHADPQAPALIFDAACRASEAPSRLGSLYRLASEADFRAVADIGQVIWRCDSQLEIAAPAAPPSAAGTHRWRYRIIAPAD